MCLLLILLLLGPRTAIFFWWLTSPERWDRAYDSFLVPFLGFVLAPWTTLAYVVVAPAGVNGLDYFVLGVALLVDIGASGSGSDRARRRRA
jgi:hypothetical protein